MARPSVEVPEGGGGDLYFVCYVYVANFHKRGLVMTKCGIANNKPASRGTESINEETRF